MKKETKVATNGSETTQYKRTTILKALCNAFIDEEIQETILQNECFLI